MKKDELWEAYRFVNPMIGDTYQAWSFGVEADELANLVVSGQKCATSSLYVWYERGEERLPQVSDYNIILNGREEAVCIVETIKVSIVPFNEVTEEHAFKEGEGDRRLETWRTTHRDFFSKELLEMGLHFHDEMPVVCEEFQVVYKP
ncbi:ASCH domain-containing protein [Turicibacter sp. 1E2]|uniref:ASCH domain-containing protein n=1 Tax=Turicibacter sp. 1E2 TaxID=2951143 RepID=UPI0021D4C636|nr:ASCH domain-containing protein [Turicibacter sp. 1E2]MCU7208564.1 ASCH domain-containing protein [Turicibacter sp. 1E2]